MLFKYLKDFDTFPTARSELEAVGITFISISTIDNVIHVEVDSIIEHPDFVAVE